MHREPAYATRPRMVPTRHGLSEETRSGMVSLLNRRLADALDLYSQTKHAHWNVKGMAFYQLHLLFDQLAESVEGHADLLAERATALGGSAYGTLRMAAATSSLPEMPTDVASGRDFVDALIERYAESSRAARDAIDRAEESGDKVTADLITEIAREIDKSLYLLEAHVQEGGR